MSLIPELFWESNGATQRKALSPVVLNASQTLRVNTSSLLKQAGLAQFNGRFSLTYKTTAPSEALVLAGGSVDQTGTFVFQVLPHEIRESMAKTISYWSTGNGNDTMVTLWNPSDDPQAFRFTVEYKGGTYIMPLKLGPRASRFFNIAALIHDQIPDSKGHTIPTNITEGVLAFRGLLLTMSTYS